MYNTNHKYVAKSILILIIAYQIFQQDYLIKYSQYYISLDMAMILHHILYHYH